MESFPAFALGVTRQTPSGLCFTQTMRSQTWGKTNTCVTCSAEVAFPKATTLPRVGYSYLSMPPQLLVGRVTIVVLAAWVHNDPMHVGGKMQHCAERRRTALQY